jgi:replicative DNA helicase
MSSTISLATQITGLKIPPQSIDSEKALLGSIMIRPDSLNEIIDMISGKTFYVEKHRIIYENILELYAQGKPLDIISLSEKLKSKKILDQIGGRSYLSEIIEAVPSSANIKHYAETIVTKHLLRKLIEASEHISGLGYNESRAIDEILDDAEKRVFEITNFNSKKTLVEIKEVLGEAWERIDKLHKNKGEIRGVPTGFKSLDNKLAGFQNSDLIILAARPSIGKTSLALDFARKAAINHNVHTAIFSLEMSTQQLTDRLLAAQAGVNSWELRTGNIKNEEDFDKIRDALDVLSRAPISVDDKPANNIISMRSAARKLKSEKGLGLIIVDYLQLMVPTHNRSNDNLVQQVTEISRSLKALARELNVPVIALSQLSRKVEERGGKPRLSDLRDSGSIEQDADVVMFIHREDRYKEDSDRKNIAEILIEKHRNGPTGKVELYFDETKSTFMDIDKSEYGGDSDFGNF